MFQNVKGNIDVMNKLEIREHIILESEGQKIFGVIHRPTNTQETKTPAVLMCHGLGGHKIGKHRLYVEFAERLAQTGITVLRFDFRGSGDSEGQFAEMTIESELQDALVALDFLQHDSCVDSTRIGIFGRSFGGVVSILAASTIGGIKSLALWAPLFSGDPWRNLWQMMQTKAISEKQSQALMQVNGVRPGLKFFEQLFQLNLAKQMDDLQDVPFLHIWGEKDQVVSSYHAEKFQEMRQRAAGKSQFIQYSNSDHEFSDSIERYKALEQTLIWFQDTL